MPGSVPSRTFRLLATLLGGGLAVGLAIFMWPGFGLGAALPLLIPALVWRVGQAPFPWLRSVLAHGLAFLVVMVYLWSPLSIVVVTVVTTPLSTAVAVGAESTGLDVGALSDILFLVPYGLLWAPVVLIPLLLLYLFLRGTAAQRRLGSHWLLWQVAFWSVHSLFPVP